jgi:AcrR family transcriptional regulator
MATQVNPNDPRVKRTRQLLQQSFVELLHERSFESITVLDIAERATLNRATFYAHFADKYALLDATIGASFTAALLKQVPAEATMGEETVRRLILAVCAYHQDLSKQCQRAHQTLALLLEPGIMTHLQAVVRDCLAREESADSPDPEVLDLAATVISWSVYGAVVRWNKSGRSEPPESLAAAVLPLIMGSVAVVQTHAGHPSPGPA